MGLRWRVTRKIIGATSVFGLFLTCFLWWSLSLWSIPDSMHPKISTTSSFQSTSVSGMSNSEALSFVRQLEYHENRYYSQNKEDGVSEAIFKKINAKFKYYVEFGVGDAMQCNTRIFRETYHWKGLLMDVNYANPSINLMREIIYPNNIVQLFEKYQVPKEFDFLSVDTNLKDFWILRHLLQAGYRPRVIISEVNTFLGPSDSLTVPLNTSQEYWDMHSQYFGYSVTAGWHLARYYGYSMIYCEVEGVNCYFIIDGVEGFGKDTKLSDSLLPDHLWKPPRRQIHGKDLEYHPYETVKANLS